MTVHNGLAGHFARIDSNVDNHRQPTSSLPTIRRVAPCGLQSKSGALNDQDDLRNSPQDFSITCGAKGAFLGSTGDAEAIELPIPFMITLTSLT